MKSVEHVQREDLEAYAMRSMPAPELESLEEHLLICQSCRDRLESTDEYVMAMKTAAGKIGQD